MREAADVALELIGKRGTLRTPAIAEALGVGEAAVDAMLAPHCASGKLVTCSIEQGERKVIEYRISMSGGGKLVSYAPNAPRAMPHAVHEAARARHVERVLNRTTEPAAQRMPAKATSGGDARVDSPGGTGLESATGAHLGSARAAAATTNQGDTVKTFVEKVSEMFRSHGPLTTRELTARGIDDDNTSTLVGQLAARGTFKVLGGGKRSRIYGLPDQTSADRKVEAGAPPSKKPAAAKAPRSSHRKRRAHPKKRAGGGSVAPRRKRAVKAPKKAFRPALASDGAILLLGASRGEFEIPRDQARSLVDLQRRLTAPEIADLVNFVTRLDNAEVGS